MRRPSSNEKKRAAGTYTPSRGRELPTLCRGKPKMPQTLSSGARKVWKKTVARMIRAGTVAEIHTDALALYCKVQSQFEANPADAKPSMVAQLRMLMGELGLTPASRNQVPVLPEATEGGSTRSPAPRFTHETGNVVSVSDWLEPT